jgi:hypothetical protein
MSADIRRLEYVHREPPLGELRRISTPAALCHAPAGKLSTENRYSWHVWVNTPFYAERDTQPQKWYTRIAAGVTVKFDDLPPGDRAHVDTQPPFGGHAGDAPALSEADISDITAFLNTLTDGYAPQRR